MELIAMLILMAAVGALILWPLLRRAAPAPAPAASAAAPQAGPSRMALAAIKELEFDYATGKIAEDDYRALRARYEARAIEPLSEPAVAPPVSDPDAALEAEIRAARGRRFCTACGGALPSAAKFCPACGAPVEVRS